MAFLANEGLPLFIGIRFAAFEGETLVHQPLGDHDMGESVDQRYIRAWLQFEVIVGLDMHRTNQVDIARVGHDQPRTLANPALHGRTENGMPIGRVGADHQDHVGLANGVEGLGTRGFTQGLLQTVTGRRMTDTGAGVDVVVAEGRTNQFLHQIGFFVGTATGGQTTD